jgi:hypothetical protein
MKNQIEPFLDAIFSKNPNVEKFIITNQGGPRQNVLYTLTLSQSMIEYKEVDDVYPKNITYSLETQEIELNKRPMSPEYQQTFLKQFRAAFSDLQCSRARLFEQLKNNESLKNQIFRGQMYGS